MASAFRCPSDSCDLVSQYRKAPKAASCLGLEQIGASWAAVIALENFHRLVDRLQARGAAAAVRVVLADQLAVAQLDQRVVHRAVFQLEQGQRGGLLAVALHARPEALQQLFHVALGGVAQVAFVQVVVAQRVALHQARRAGLPGQQADLQRADLQEASLFGAKLIAQAVEGVEHQEVGAEQHQLVQQRQVRDMGGMPRLQLLDQLIFGKAFRGLAQQFEQLPGEVEAGVEVGSHGHEPSIRLPMKAGCA